MHAKLLQSFSTLCYLMDCSPPGFSVLGIPHPWNSPSKNTGVDCHALLLGNFTTQKLNLCLLCLTALAGGFFTYWATWEAPRRIKPPHSRESAKYGREWRCCFSLYRHFIVSVWMKPSLCIQVIRLETGWKEWEKLLTFVEHSKYRWDCESAIRMSMCWRWCWRQLYQVNNDSFCAVNMKIESVSVSQIHDSILFLFNGNRCYEEIESEVNLMETVSLCYTLCKNANSFSLFSFNFNFYKKI